MFPSKKQLNYASKIARSLGIDMPDTMDIRSVTQFINTYKQAYYEKQNQEIYAQIAREIRITDYAQELGYTLVRKGKYYSLKEHDSVMIDPDKNYFWRNSIPGETSHAIGYGDTVIGFAKMFSGKSMRDILDDFSKRLSGNSLKQDLPDKQPEAKLPEVSLEIPDAGENMRRVYAYLIKTRYIEPEIVQRFVDEKMLYQDKSGNCVFVGYDEKQNPVYVCQHGTNTFKRFVRDCEGCDYGYGIYLNHAADKLIITEAAIDCMSLMSIQLAKNQDLKDYNYLIQAGSCKIEAIVKHVKKDHIKELYLAVDNDDGGKKAIKAIKNLLHENDIDIPIYECLPQNKDWNEEIVTAFKHGVRYKDIELPEMEVSKSDQERTATHNVSSKYYHQYMNKHRGLERSVSQEISGQIER